MRKIIINIVSVLTILLMVGCQEDDLKFGKLQAPTNLVITAEIVGKSDADPNGDGSGLVKLVATASDAISYKYVI